MRVLVTIPHYYRRHPDQPGLGAPTLYGSDSETLEARRNQVEQCLVSLVQTFSDRQALAGQTGRPPANDALAVKMDVVLVTTGTQHLADLIARPLFLHCATEADPRCLGFVCHELMRERAAEYDYFVYLEDDIQITDPLFFAKLTWFNAQFGHSALLQPNRFELATDLQTTKMYLDGNLVQPGLAARHQDITTRPRLVAEAFGQPILFKRVSNAHSGCFFVNAEQLARLAAAPQFGKPSADFFGPLETAATMLIMRVFEVYKPARQNAGFLEAQHLGRRFLLPTPTPETPPEPEPTQ